MREGVDDDISIFGLTINANLGFADLTSATSYLGPLGVQTQDASESIYVRQWRQHSLSCRSRTRSATRRTSSARKSA